MQTASYIIITVSNHKTPSQYLWTHVGLPPSQSSHSPYLIIFSATSHCPIFFYPWAIDWKQTLLYKSLHLHFKHDWSSAPSPHFIFTTTSSKTQHPHVPPHLQKWRTAIYRSITGVFKSSSVVNNNINNNNNNNSNNYIHKISQTVELTFHHPTKKLLLLLHPHRCLPAVPVGPRTNEGK